MKLYLYRFLFTVGTWIATFIYMLATFLIWARVAANAPETIQRVSALLLIMTWVAGLLSMLLFWTAHRLKWARRDKEHGIYKWQEDMA